MKSMDGKRRLAAIAFTDIVGYSALVNRDDANAMRLVREHFALVREIAGRFDGKVIKTIGDSVHLEFDSAQAATSCSIAIQQAHRQRNARVAEAQRFDIRIGVHIGDVEQRDGDIYGDGVNIAARLQPLAPVGGIAISDHVRNQLRLDLRNRFTSRGLPQLKNIETPIELFLLEGDALAAIQSDRPSADASVPAAVRTTRLRRWPIIVATVVGVALLALGVALVPHTQRGADAPDTSIAVLPFVDMSQAKDQEYFSDGIADDLLNLLTKVPALQVAARTSSFSFKGKDASIQEIAKALHVSHLLQGSVRKSGNAVRITAQLVRATDGRQIWSQSWDRQLDDVFKIQDEIALAVVDQLKVQILGEAPTAKPVDPRVYPMILQAQALADQVSQSGRAQSVEVLLQALAIAPDESRAWAALGRVYTNQGIFGERPVADAVVRIKEAANKALEHDPANALALAMLGRCASDLELDLPTAARYYERAMGVAPGNLNALTAAAALLQAVGRLEEGVRINRYLAARDPANPTTLHNLGFALYAARQWDAALEATRTSLRLSPGASVTRAQLGTLLLVGKQDAAGALKEFDAEPDEVTRLVGRAQALHALGRTPEADAALQTLLGKYGNDQPEYIATVYGFRKDADATFEWLEKAVPIRDPGLVTVLTEPIFDFLHDDPRWLPFLRKIGYAPEQIAKIELRVTLPEAPPPEN